MYVFMLSNYHDFLNILSFCFREVRVFFFFPQLGKIRNIMSDENPCWVQFVTLFLSFGPSFPSMHSSQSLLITHISVIILLTYFFAGPYSVFFFFFLHDLFLHVKIFYKWSLIKHLQKIILSIFLLMGKPGCLYNSHTYHIEIDTMKIKTLLLPMCFPTIWWFFFFFCKSPF